MKLCMGLHLLMATCLLALTLAKELNITCYYDTFSINRTGSAHFNTRHLENALPMCDIVVYGYVGIRPETFEVITLHPQQHQQFALVKLLKKKYRNVKFLLSLGGDKDLTDYEKYLQLLEASKYEKNRFIQWATEFVRKYKFDGFDLAYQLPRNFTYHPNPHINRKTEYYRQQMTNIIKNLGLALKKYELMLTLTVLPNINAKYYYNANAIMESLDFITLAAFDFSLPQHTPKEANFSTTHNDDRFQRANIEYQMKQWLETVPAKKLNLGIAAFGRAWNTTQPLIDPIMPVSNFLNGSAPGAFTTRTTGLLAWPEICKKLSNLSEVNSKTLGSYAYTKDSSNDEKGILITYESPDTAVEKVTYAQRHELFGVALFDLTLDDFRGKCRCEKFVMLRTIKSKLDT